MATKHVLAVGAIGILAIVGIVGLDGVCAGASTGDACAR
jgi:hypothetical protein